MVAVLKVSMFWQVSGEFGTIKQSIHISSKRKSLEHGKEKAIISFKNLWKLAQRNGKAGIPTISKSHTSCADFNLGSGCEGSGTSKDLPTLRPRVEGENETQNLQRRGKGCVEFCDFEPCLKINFGVSVNGVPHFSTRMDGEKPVLGQME
ncbi:hypothetical protein AVEN_123475-1 [Araneus ventricosus]|uniref:Uncharacterized protein n=1 Tax=Araneus ventricosus TaxID=182803 RepID=A0A4Y2VTT5_ARAVE|nr:hypothetical protein AVEN_191690-1 [Araneus ventricosus]GBO27808.1 hypothetical protein AVEN_123475-1 [Araneus ventricosus]